MLDRIAVTADPLLIPASRLKVGLTRDDDATTRDQRRSRRHHAVRALTITAVRLGKMALEAAGVLYPDEDIERPRTRADCVDVPRPCPFVSCRHNLYLDVSGVGSIKLNFPDREPDEMIESCALDVGDSGGATLDDVGAMMNVTRERIRQIEARALSRAARNPRVISVLRELAPDDVFIGPPPKPGGRRA